MRAQMKKIDDISIVYLSGKMNLDSAENFQTICENSFVGKKIIFGLQDLSFVGSTGISVFLDTLNSYFRKCAQPVKMFSVSSEFDRIFSANLESYINFETENLAVLSFYQQATPTQDILDSTSFEASGDRYSTAFQDDVESAPQSVTPIGGATSGPVLGMSPSVHVPSSGTLQAEEEEAVSIGEESPAAISPSINRE
ncbi:MAG: hypothetical protein CL677_03005 [Bdellovibrionaceae bacterium]|nr:hypothetical protein [Pseudobdellovibrionaceae bacterium]|tara:strand:- start:89520 stop:90110 length:591 start_codon:yes stop_codon:yes gene_type:complete